MGERNGETGELEEEDGGEEWLIELEDTRLNELIRARSDLEIIGGVGEEEADVGEGG